ncbi:IgGFc-binding protein [Chanodichthys erythropterus]|uniref:IgGFc-binding protein n=1 Tax=Chanodichthys erythropterus TaxID=933992 RepID=UPI00351DB10C
MLTVLLTILMFSQGLSMDSRGMSFITAFPENIAVYYKKTINLLKITTLHPNTKVSVTSIATGIVNTNESLRNGTILTVNLTKEDEEYQFISSNKSFRITSDKNITVLSVSGWEGRFQSNVVQPEQNLGTVYQVPALNYTKIATSFSPLITSEGGFLFFRLMIINAMDKVNNVTIKQVDERGQSKADNITLGPYKLFQIQINGTVREINANDKVAVLLTHPCFDSKNCSCNMVVNQLKPPVIDDEKIPARFLIPPIFSAKQLLVTTNQPFKVCQGLCNNINGILVQNSTDILPLFPNFTNASVISTNVHVSLQLISPGLILDLIPTSMFSGCYLLGFNSSRSGALVIANTSRTDGVKINDQPLPSHIKWNVLNGTEYSWALVEAQEIGTIWHPTSKIGVYMIELLESNNIYGSPAIAINMDTDHNGCLVTPEMFVLGKDEMTWFMSRKYCLENADQLARFVAKDNLEKMASNMTHREPTEGWISLRRALYTAEWYWKNEDDFPSTVNFTYWEDGQPEKPEKGLCASVSLDPKKKFMWKSARCCSKKKPVCYNSPKYLTYRDCNTVNN